MLQNLFIGSKHMGNRRTFEIKVFVLTDKAFWVIKEEKKHRDIDYLWKHSKVVLTTGSGS